MTTRKPLKRRLEGEGEQERNSLRKTKRSKRSLRRPAEGEENASSAAEEEDSVIMAEGEEVKGKVSGMVIIVIMQFDNHHGNGSDFRAPFPATPPLIGAPHFVSCPVAPPTWIGCLKLFLVVLSQHVTKT